MQVKLTKVWNTGERRDQEIEVPDGVAVAAFVRRAAHTDDPDGIWSEPDGSRLENLENTSVDARQASGLIYRGDNTFDRIDITW